MKAEVLIVGAGPTGLALALALHKQKIPFRIIEKNSGPGTASRAMIVHGRILEHYRQMGFAEMIIEQGNKVEDVQIFMDGNLKAKMHIGDIGENLSRFPYILSLPQDIHEEILVRVLKERGVEVEWNTQLMSFKESDHHVQVVIEKEGITEENNFVFLCGCDGAHSSVRKNLGFQFEGGTYAQIFYVADVKSSIPSPGISGNMFREGFCLTIPLPNGNVRLIGIFPEEVVKDGIPSELAPVIPFIEKNVGIKIEQVNWYSPYKVHHRISDHFRKGRIFLAGDAGHIHSPAGGQGMNTGIGDAVNLGWKLAAVMLEKADEKILDTYETERMAFAKMLISTTDRAFNSVVGKGVETRLFKNAVIPYALPRLIAFPRLRKKLYKKVSQTDIKYRDSILSEGQIGQIHGGDRLPWVTTENSDNHEPLKSMDWQFHIYGQDLPELRAIAESSAIPLYVFKWKKEMDAVGIKENSIMLIRPDGHIALAITNRELVKAQKYLDEFKIYSINS
ncbi:FAD-dependent monooxygenase [Planomicrobium sp. CPCC 101079]|uniref:FAD-dependent monooxygenase n=1 Tax=Planomicrobium sp. CPCC 101079 TaxID=2599618 RepID=UPI0011B4F022|nr:FAD-dependent monooxygenase [Planomicrobium sp. CPCC 101079]TWT14324.1 monooxygenase [Planomicrobium sp. CPCC 101079]